jgi:hypothetical protein
MAVQYERAVSEPEQAFKALAAFLQIPYTLAMVQGIYSSSIRKAARPNIDRQIELECEALWQRLCLASGPNSPQ